MPSKARSDRWRGSGEERGNVGILSIAWNASQMQRREGKLCPPWPLDFSSAQLEGEEQQEGDGHKAQVLVSGDYFIKMLGLDFPSAKWDLVKQSRKKSI